MGLYYRKAESESSRRATLTSITFSRVKDLVLRLALLISLTFEHYLPPGQHWNGESVEFQTNQVNILLILHSHDLFDIASNPIVSLENSKKSQMKRPVKSFKKAYCKSNIFIRMLLIPQECKWQSFQCLSILVKLCLITFFLRIRGSCIFLFSGLNLIQAWLKKKFLHLVFNLKSYFAWVQCL